MVKGFIVGFHTLLTLTIIALTSCTSKLNSITNTRIALGTYVKITIVANRSDTASAQSAIDSAYEMIDEYQHLFDYRSRNGALAVFNESTALTGKDDERLFPLLVEALKYAHYTQGYFDPTILPVVQLWGFDTNSPRLPPAEEIERMVQLVGYEKAVLTEDGIEKPQWLQFDLSAIAKGKIVDLIRDYLQELGYTSFLIDAGGDIYVRGLNSNRKKWRIAIQDPERRDRFSGIVEKTETAIVTSGDYENFFEEGGKRYSHLFNPRTGYPESNCRSVTILAPDTAFADAIATAVFVMGSESGRAFLKENRIEGLIIFQTAGGKIETFNTPGFWK